MPDQSGEAFLRTSFHRTTHTDRNHAPIWNVTERKNGATPLPRPQIGKNLVDWQGVGEWNSLHVQGTSSRTGAHHNSNCLCIDIGDITTARDAERPSWVKKRANPRHYNAVEPCA